MGVQNGGGDERRGSGGSFGNENMEGKNVTKGLGLLSSVWSF